MGLIKHGTPEPAEVEGDSTLLANVTVEETDPQNPPPGAFRVSSADEDIPVELAGDAVPLTPERAEEHEEWASFGEEGTER